jgi:hypothetical protein
VELPRAEGPTPRAGPAGEASSRRRSGGLRAAAIRIASTRAVHAVARAGFVAKAALYGVIGVHALRAALRRGGATLDVKGALERITDGRLGNVAVAAAGLGIAGLGFWFVLEAIVNPWRQRGAWGTASRIGQAIGGLAYAALGALGLRLAFGEAGGPDGDALAQSGVAEAFRFPGGPALAVLAGAVIVGVGLRQMHLGLSGRFLETVDLSPAAPALRRLAARAGAFGFAVQGSLFALVGIFLVQAVLEHEPREATGTGGALNVLAGKPHGTVLLGVAALGLLSYALYAGIEGACKRLPGPRRTSGPAMASSAVRAPPGRGAPGHGHLDRGR